MKSCDHNTLFTVAVMVDDQRQKAHYLMQCEVCEKQFVYPVEMPGAEYNANQELRERGKAGKR